MSGFTLTFLIGLLMLVITIIAFHQNIKNLFKKRKIQANGKPSRATVLTVKDTGNRFNYNPEVIIQLTFNTDQQETINSELTAILSATELNTIQVGSMIDVLYDPKQPQQVALAKS